MSVLLDSLAAGFHGDITHRAVLDAALRDGLPGPRNEAWKYTSLRGLERRSFGTATDADTGKATRGDARLQAIEGLRAVFVNGHFDATMSRLPPQGDGVVLMPLAASSLQGDADAIRPAEQPLDRSEAVFARLNVALARDGVALRIGEGVRLPDPLHLVFMGAPAECDIAVHLRHLIDVGHGANATIVEHHFATGVHANLANHLWRVRIGEGARLHHARLQQEAEAATSFARTDAVLGRDAHYRRIDLELGAALSRHELNVRLEGERARLDANGVLLGHARRHLDTRLGIEHVAPDTACTLSWRGLASDRSRVAFHGGITIQAGADGSDANLSNKNLMLSESAEIDTQPVLEIHADEVTAAHGATVGQLDPTALFYLRSRGLSERDARRLLTAAFCREVVAQIDLQEPRESLESALDGALTATGSQQ